jgi:multiple sugar transport system permease protein
VAVFNVMSFEQINWGPLAAAALLITAPVLLLTLTVQRHIVASLAAGGLKG